MNNLPVMESFFTIQGEGFYSGKPAWFIRLAGCDVGCTWCDVKESWDASLYSNKEISDLTSEIVQSQVQIVIVTGGEPLIHDLGPLTHALKSIGVKTHLETSAAYAISGDWDWVTVSPKKFKKPLIPVLKIADELKVIIYNKSDFEWAVQNAQEVSEQCKLFVQPEWERSSLMQPQIVEFVKKNQEWEISLQMHKYLDVP